MSNKKVISLNEVLKPMTYEETTERLEKVHSDLREKFNQWCNLENNPLRQMKDHEHPLPVTFEAGYNLGLSEKLNAVPALLQYRYRESNKNSVDYGQYSEWKTISLDGYKDVEFFISKGHYYETRKLFALQETFLADNIEDLND